MKLVMESLCLQLRVIRILKSSTDEVVIAACRSFVHDPSVL